MQSPQLELDKLLHLCRKTKETILIVIPLLSRNKFTYTSINIMDISTWYLSIHSEFGVTEMNQNLG